MKCGTGLGGHCDVNHRYVCRNGPVFSLAELTGRPDGRPYADREIASLQEVLALVSRAMGLVEGRPAATPPVG